MIRRCLGDRTGCRYDLNDMVLSGGFDVLRSTHRGSLIYGGVSAGILTQPCLRAWTHRQAVNRSGPAETLACGGDPTLW